jgi:Protein of unknown function (DUF3074)
VLLIQARHQSPSALEMASSASTPTQSIVQPSTLVRLAPLQLSEVPAHRDLPVKSDKYASLAPPTNGADESQQPELLPFLTTLLNDGLAFLSRRSLEEKFKHHSNKPASPSTNDVEVLTHSISPATLNDLPWAGSGLQRSGSSASTNGAPSLLKVRRKKPKTLQAEYWFARRSIHDNISSKNGDKPGHASWEEFLYGLRDNHSKHEEDFTPTLFDARKVVDWSGQLRKLEEEGSVSREGYRDATMSIYEMCHDVPSPLKPRAFGVLVATASLVGKKNMAEGDQEKFVAVTVPVQLGMDVKAAFYANFKNLQQGEDSKKKREMVQGLYCAVETCTLRKKAQGDSEEIEWVMATASDAKGILPMWMQKLALPGTVPKDVGYFMKWIKTVDDSKIESGEG